MVKVGVFLILMSCAATLGCGDGDDNPADAGEAGAGGTSGTGGTSGSGGSSGSGADSIEIEGTWEASFLGTPSGEETITDEAWTSFATQAIVEFSNEENYAIWQNPSDAQFNPDKFGRNVWTEIEDGSFYYCTVAYMSDTAEATEDDAETADDSDLEAGCGAMGSPWTLMTRK